MDWAQILVIILAIALAVFLVAAIILVIMLIKVTKQIKKVTGSARQTVMNVEKAVTTITSLASTNAILGMIMKQFMKGKKK